ncbi:hypothetical protein C0991_003952 [Blastosporella zonata]|nr:hypothetical protein C0991_003952 [Blastosporella zonata]
MTTTTTPLLELREIACHRDGQVILDGVKLAIHQGDIVVLRGKSGSGKSTLLKCIAHLIVYDGDILYRSSSPKSIGIPSFRTRVLYVPQRPSILPGTPHAFLKTLTSLEAHKAHHRTLKKAHDVSVDPFERAQDISRKWDIDPELWEREWSNLSGGEAQRLALSIAVGLNTAEIILLDGLLYPFHLQPLLTNSPEPTSALDAASSAAVEQFLLSEIRSPDAMLKAIVWITHSDEQAGRIGSRFFQVAGGGCYEEPSPAV